MKLHLPKVLLTAVLLAATITQLAKAENSVVNPDAEHTPSEQAYQLIFVDQTINNQAQLSTSGTEDNRKLDIGLYSKKNDAGIDYYFNKKFLGIGTPVLLSDDRNTATHTGHLTLKGNDQLGAFDDNGNLITSFTKYTLSGIQSDELGMFVHKNDTQGTVSNNLKVTGTLTIKENAQVILGGQVATNQYAEYAGVIADKVVVSGYDDDKTNNTKAVDNLNVWNANVNVLEVNSGIVKINPTQNGNNYFVFNAPVDSKQVRIKQALNINGGKTYINIYNQLDKYNTADEQHILASFGNVELINGSYNGGIPTSADSAKIHKAWINQTAGELTVQGKTASVGGLNIKQSGGTMNISSDGTSYHSWHILSDYGDSSITQENDATMTIGGIKAYNNNYDKVVDLLESKGVVYDESNKEFNQNGVTMEINPSISIEQKGNGKITIVKGIDFINQDTGATSTEKSTITQSGGGFINLNGEYKGVEFDITQKENGGIINISGVAGDADSFNAGNIIQNAGTINVGEKAKLTADTLKVGAAIQAKSEAAPAAIEATEVTLTNGSLSTTENKLTISGDLSAAELIINNGEVVNLGTITVNGSIVLNDGSVFKTNGNAAAASTFALMAATAIETEHMLAVKANAIIVNTGAELDNSDGTVLADIIVNGGTVTLGTGTTGNIEMKSGELFVTGTVETGSLTLKGGTMYFSEGAVVELSEQDIVNLSGTNIVIMVDNVNTLEETSIVNLFQSSSEDDATDYITNWEGTTVTFMDDNNGSVTGTISGTVDGGLEVTIPEPATATLSLLALAGLAMRRRRAA